MGTITKRKRADGSIAYRYEIRIKKKGKIIHQEAETFDQKRLAEEWGRRRELALQAPGALDALRSRRSIGQLLEWYIDSLGKSFGRSKLSSIEFLTKQPIATVDIQRLTAARLIQHVQERRKEGAGPATVANDLIWLRIVCKAARPALGLQIDLQIIDDAAAFCREHRFIARPRQRDRRPTADELQRLHAYFSSRDGRAELPMVDIMWFALHSTRRQGEIVELLWSDNNDTELTGIVRDAKHPTAKMGNHRTFKYAPEAWEIVQRQPRTDSRIFPYKAKSIGAAFIRACHVLEIEDLRFHDLRHEGTSRLFERGYSIQEVQQFTLHESWSTLQRYTHLRPGDVKHR